MDNSLEIKLTYTTEDFARALPFIQQHALKRKYWIFILPIGTFLGILWLINSMKDKSDNLNYLAILIFAFIPSLFMFLVVWILDKKAGWISKADKVSPWVMNREVLKLFKKNPHLSEVTTITISNKEVSYSSASSTQNLDWVLFSKSIETDSDIFLFTLTNDVRFIPKRTLESEEQKNLLYNLIKRNLGSKAKF